MIASRGALQEGWPLPLVSPATRQTAPFPPPPTAIHAFTMQAMDSLKLNMVAVDQIYPLLSDLVQAMMKVGAAPACAWQLGRGWGWCWLCAA